jgi:hypothetical protein
MHDMRILNRRQTVVHIKTYSSENQDREKGAALVTVLFISLLLITASAAMLTAVGSNSRNTTDVLSETKAYYAAETGLQASVNVLRNSVDVSGNQLTYPNVILDPNLHTWLPPYVNVGGQTQVQIGGSVTGTGYSINVTNPDAGTVSYTSAMHFAGPETGVVYERSGDKNHIAIPSYSDANHWEIDLTEPPGGNPSTPNTLLGTFSVTKVGNGSTMALGTASLGAKFRIDFRILATPRSGVASVYGVIKQTTPGDPNSGFTVNFDSSGYLVLGTTVRLARQDGTTTWPITLSISDVSPPGPATIYFNAGSFIPSPYRLKVISTGYGPGGSEKTLEGIVRRNFFDGYDAPSTMLLVGPYRNDGLVPPSTPDFHYAPGNSNGSAYSGGTCSDRCVPSFGVTDQNVLDEIDRINYNGGTNSINVNPGSQLIDLANLPPWIQSPAALEILVNQLRAGAQQDGRYFTLGGASIPNFSSDSIANGTGITFCEGSCKLNSDGGGILVVTGSLVYKGSVNFKGFVIVTGQGGWNRDGGGGNSNGQIRANIVIAPYNRSPYTYPYPAGQTSSVFLAPWYDMGGGGASVLGNTDQNLLLDNTSAVSDIVVGVAEK